MFKFVGLNSVHSAFDWSESFAVRTSTDITPAEWRSAPKWAMENHVGSVPQPRTSLRHPIKYDLYVGHFIGTDGSKYSRAASVNSEKFYHDLKKLSKSEVSRFSRVVVSLFLV